MLKVCTCNFGICSLYCLKSKVLKHCMFIFPWEFYSIWLMLSFLANGNSTLLRFCMSALSFAMKISNMYISLWICKMIALTGFQYFGYKWFCLCTFQSIDYCLSNDCWSYNYSYIWLLLAIIEERIPLK